MRVTFHYTFVAVPLRLIFALMVAMMLLKGSKLTGILRAAYYLPSMIGGSVAAAILWRMTFRADGPLNGFIQIFFPEFSLAWAGDVRTAIYVLILLAVWQFGSAMLIFLASLKQVPDYLYEAADIDGAGRAHKFSKITLPLLTPTIFFNLVMQTISGLLVFAQVFVIFTQRGEPQGSTRVVALQMYRMAFEFQRAGDASAYAWGALIIISLITGILFATKRFWVYDGGL
jgi:multiple sugar transport system permease protein